MQNLFSKMLASAALLGAALPSVFAQNYTITDLGGVGNESSFGAGINNAGTIVGKFLTTGPIATRWTNNGLTRTPMGTMGGGLYSEATDINTAGKVCGFSDLDDIFIDGEDWDLIHHAFIWDGGTFTDLGVINGAYQSEAYDLNDSDTVVGWLRFPNSTHGAFRWQGGVMQALPTLGGQSAGANAINNSGQVVGRAQDATGKLRAVIWNGLVPTDLGSLGGTSGAEAIDIAENGVIVGYAANSSNRVRAFRRNGTTMNALGILGTGALTTSAAYSVNESGRVVGWCQASGQARKAVMWQPGSTVARDLTAFIVANPGWQLREAYSVNDSGRITGIGIIGGKLHGFLLTPQ